MDNQTFTITPATGYDVDTLTTKAGSNTATPVTPTANGDGTYSYNLVNIQDDYVVTVTFKVIDYTWTATCVNGTVTSASSITINVNTGGYFDFAPTSSLYEYDTYSPTGDSTVTQSTDKLTIAAQAKNGTVVYKYKKKTF